MNFSISSNAFTPNLYELIAWSKDTYCVNALRLLSNSYCSNDVVIEVLPWAILDFSSITVSILAFEK